MGVFNLFCVTTDPDATSFFGFAYAEGYSSTLLQPQYAALVESNTDPTSPGDLNWSVVSKFDGSKLSGYPGTMEPRVGYNGRGAWANISVTDGFSWSGPFSRHALGYASGEQHTPREINTSPDDGNGNSYIYGLGASNRIALSCQDSLSQASVQQYLPAHVTTPLCSFQFPSALHPATILQSQSSTSITYSGSYPSTLYTIRDPSTSLVLSSEVQFNADVVNMVYFVPIGTGSGASTFALIRKYKEIYAFDNVNGFRYTHLVKVVNVTDPPTPESSSSPLSAGGIWGIAVGYPDSSYTGGQAGSTDTLPMVPITPMPEHMQEKSWKYYRI
ncbi:hypothetical protein EC957_007849 [Mortierella hygrophila]|uniref:Uncharacterized protein n=1 Tax=Mortierella hygrophila TaxID=979708 RepID=A0A9P6EXG8_9FUNG|nr:hypothetical protein EC957_007849 [Mortierella hygrophila]